MRSATWVGVGVMGALLAACQSDPGGGADVDPSATGTIQLAMSLPAEELRVAGIQFEAIDSDGNVAADAVLPLEEEPLPASRDPELAGRTFADWLVLLPVGTYDVNATPVDENGAPSSFCSAASTRVTVIAGATVEAMLVSFCSGPGSGAIDVTVSFDQAPVFESIDLETSKFVCANESFVATFVAKDPDGLPLNWDWQVSGLPTGASSDSYCLSSTAGRGAFTASQPGEYQLRVAIDDGLSSVAQTIPIFVSDCGDPPVCLGEQNEQSLGQPSTAQVGNCSCEGVGTPQVARERNGITIELDRLFYGPQEPVQVTLNTGGRELNAEGIEILIGGPNTTDSERMVLTRQSAGVYTTANTVLLSGSGATGTSLDGVLELAPGEPFFAVYFPDPNDPALADIETNMIADIGFLDDPNAPVAAVDAAVALTDDEGSSLGKPVGTLVRRDAHPVQVATEEVILWTENDDALERFLTETGGQVVQTEALTPSGQGAQLEAMHRVILPPDPDAARHLTILERFLGEDRELLASNSEVLSIMGRVLELRLNGWTVAVNPRLQYQGAPEISPAEAGQTTHTMQLTSGCMPGDPSRPCTENAPALWAFTALWDGDDARINTAVLDMGFAANSDFRAPASGTFRECDMTANGGPLCAAGAAQGSPTVGNSFFGDRSWHGTGVVATLGGVVNNGEHAAGTGGQVAVPMLYKYDTLAYAFEIGSGINLAVADGASCINISGGYPCNILTNIGPDWNLCSPGGRATICTAVTAALAATAATACAATGWIPFVGAAVCGAATAAVVVATEACFSTLAFGNLAGPMVRAVENARREGVPVVTIAGNALSRDSLPPVLRDYVRLGNQRTEDWRIMPSMAPSAIVVGAVDDQMRNAEFFGDRVDIWAPVRTAYFAPSNVNDPSSSLTRYTIGATSAAAPYVTGVITAMMAVNPELNRNTPGLTDFEKGTIVDRIKSILTDEANSSNNVELVSRGFPSDPRRRAVIDPLAAVTAAAAGRIPDLAAEGYDTTLGFSELDRDDDTPATATPLPFGGSATGTILALPTASGPAATPDVDWYSVTTPAGARPVQFDVRLRYPGSFGRVFISEPGFRRIATDTYRVLAGPSETLRFAVRSPAGEDNVYEVSVGAAEDAIVQMEIFEPSSADTIDVCADDTVVTFEARGSVLFVGPVTVPESQISWRRGATFLGTGSRVSTVFTTGTHDVSVRAYGDVRGEDVIRVNAIPCTSEAPEAIILSPASDSGPNDPEYAYTGYDSALGLWYTDIPVQGLGFDPEDGTLSGGSLVWKTNRTDIQAEVLGTGENLTIRLYSNDCFGVEHVIQLEVTDSDGQVSIPATRIITIWTLC